MPTEATLPFEPLDIRVATFAELAAALPATVPVVFPAGRPDENPLYTVRATRCQFRNGADVRADENGELLRDESGNYEYSTPLFKWICTIGGSRTYAEKGSAEDRFDSTEAALAAALALLRKTPDWQFWDKCGDGYDAEFTPTHGKVAMGYRLSTTRDKHGVVLLHLSLCHWRQPGAAPGK